ncbi:cytochrome-c oxidase, cbb3-type subunit III [Pseudorhodoferax sp. Leaf267]|uniref:cytochrome-c oxidase, cbb3-type subunit III n=1 Tax=Pseudorhodoferax sp. Leaf267 TaxID=1736316 RepID=UPI0007020335|nr:cytochrome-c oxidase, cbb3-type subunit III [Pseudorhodoferax sp. Leaf267]KQP22794.1 cytochrome oxidase subunit III [Pseudorhodoferax sp. Leaf267]
MSDFTSSFWSIAIIVVTLGGIVGCMLLLWAAGQARVAPDGDNTTGHVWDGDLREMNNPLPRWWVWLFIITTVFGVVYLVLYPGLGDRPGTLNWSSTGEHQAAVQQMQADTAPLYAKFAGMPAADIAGDPQAMAIGERLFMNHCAQCHGSDARGSKGFPNLADGDWLWGGEPHVIVETITKGRTGQMPPMAAAVGSPDDVRNVAHYVLSLSNGPHDSVRAALGKSKFAACAACHGSNGKGNPLLGAPNLTDDVWLHGWGEDAIVAMVNGGKHNQMPAQEGKLSEAQIRVLASYVWHLSNRP